MTHDSNNVLVSELVRRLEEVARENERLRVELEQALAELATPATEEPQDQWLTVAQAAEETGISQSTIYRAIKDRTMPGAKKIRGSLRIWRPALLESDLPKPRHARGRRRGKR